MGINHQVKIYRGMGWLRDSLGKNTCATQET